MTLAVCETQNPITTTSTSCIYWVPSFQRRESEFTSTTALMLQTNRSMTPSLHWRWISAVMVMAEVSVDSNILLLTYSEYTRHQDKSCQWQSLRRRVILRHMPCTHLQFVIAACLHVAPVDSMSIRCRLDFPPLTINMLCCPHTYGLSGQGGA